ncbi:MAG: 3-deoxy-D-manno-octulosonic acid transferase [Muribaculum sp.]|nr:3-deoxy-D-manno-octulosonic acid transferase [Muribaculaceae bacterium]MCM1081145.1 3-deoxy-D-manno-octulosonic acid transferase [Muribaculum sp.]
MNPLYNTGIHLYRLGAKLVSSRNKKADRMLKGQSETFERLERNLQPGKKYVWLHAASLGEFEQGRPLLEMIRRQRPELGIVLTFFSPSGYEVRKNYPIADIICYLPFDTPANARRWVETLRPAMAIFVKYEFWGNYLEQLHHNNIPTYLISAIFRDSQSFFQWWGGTFRHMLRCYQRLFVQDNDSARRLASIGVTNVDVTGDTRFDRVTDIMRSTHTIAAMEALKASGKTIIIFGSSWEADEEIYSQWLSEHSNICAVIAPHEFDAQRLEKLSRMLPADNGQTVMLSDLLKADNPDRAVKDVRCVIVDSFGQLSSLYRYGNIAYIGGGFGHGIHNINEAAVYGIPVVFGPNHKKFKEASDLIHCGGGFSISNKQELESIFNTLTSDPACLDEAGKAAGAYIARSIGATPAIFKAIF